MFIALTEEFNLRDKQWRFLRVQKNKGGIRKARRLVSIENEMSNSCNI